MKKKIFYVLSELPSLTLYTNYDGFKNSCKALFYLYLTLDPIEDLNVYADSDKESILIWSLDSFKKPIEQDFKTDQEQEAFEQAYDRYYDKRWDEMPKVELSLSDWHSLQEKWEKIKKEKPHYVIFTLDDSGPLDKVDVVGKNELSEQDMQDINYEHKKYLKYEVARKKYIQNHSDYSYVWRGPQDDEFQADIMKYYEE